MPEAINKRASLRDRVIQGLNKTEKVTRAVTRAVFSSDINVGLGDRIALELTFSSKPSLDATRGIIEPETIPQIVSQQNHMTMGSHDRLSYHRTILEEAQEQLIAVNNATHLTEAQKAKLADSLLEKISTHRQALNILQSHSDTA